MLGFNKSIKPNEIEKGMVLYEPNIKRMVTPSFLPFVEAEGEQVTTFKIIPDFTLDNASNDIIVNAISNMYQTPRQRISIKEFTYSMPRQVYFDIVFTPKKVGFYLTIYNEYSELLEGKMHTAWGKSEIRRVNDSEFNNIYNDKAEVCELVLRDYNFKSLNTSKNDLYPLTNMMGIIKQLKDDERVRINIAIEPVKRLNWIANTKDEFNSYKKGKIVNNEMSAKEKVLKLGFTSIEVLLNLYIEYKMLIFESVIGMVAPEKDDRKEQFELKLDGIEAIKEANKYNGLTPSTTYKMTSEAFKTKISIISESKDTNRAKLNMLSVANSYKGLNSDNELVVRLLSKSEQNKLINDIMYGHVPTSKKCILSDKEICKLMQLPQRDLQKEYQIECIDTREVEIPKELQNGKVRIGIAEKQGKKVVTTWSTDKNVMSLAKVFVGPQNSGKTTAVKRTVKECYLAHYSNFIIDYVESCELAREIAEPLPERDKVIIKLGEKGFIPALAFNEVTKLITEDMDSWERVRLANLIAEQVEYLINAVTDSSTGELTAPMIRYLHAASMVTFIRPRAKINDVFEVLRRWDKRNEAIRYGKYSKCFDEDDDIFFDLNELHQRDDKGKIVGTRENLIIGILNRIIILQKNPYLKAMLKADINLNEDFNKYIDQGKSVFILIPQYIFPNQIIRDILTTFFMSRIWLTVQLRENNKDARLCNVIFDEVHQVPTTARFLSNHITEFRRHRLGLILTCHYLKQMKELLIALKSSGASYILIAGTEKENLEMLKEEIAPFTIEEGMTLKPHTSLNVINYGNQYAKFISSLPKA